MFCIYLLIRTSGIHLNKMPFHLCYLMIFNKKYPVMDINLLNCYINQHFFHVNLYVLVYIINV